MTIIRSILKNSIILGAGQALSGLLYFVAVTWLARSYGASDFGIFSFAESVFMFFSLVVIWGSDFIGAREIAKSDKSKIPTIVSSIIPMRLIFSIVSISVLAVFILIIKKPLEVKLTLAVIGVGLFSLIYLLDWLFWGMEKFGLYAQFTILRDLLFLLGVWAITHFHPDIIWAAAAFIIARFISSAFLLAFYLKQYGFKLMRFNLPAQKKLAKSCNAMFTISLVGWTAHFFDITLISIICSTELTGFYSAAYKPLLILILAIMVYMKAIFPLLSKLSDRGDGAFRKVILFSMYGSIIIFIPVAIFSSRLSGGIIGLLYGDGYSQSVAVFRVLVFILVIVPINSLYIRGLIALGKDKDSLTASSSVGISNIVLNLCLVPTIGIMGAVYSKIGAECIGLIVCHRKLSQNIPLPARTILPLAATAVVTAGICLGIVSLF